MESAKKVKPDSASIDSSTTSGPTRGPTRRPTPECSAIAPTIHLGLYQADFDDTSLNVKEQGRTGIEGK